MKACNYLENLYLEFFNTVDKFAQDHGLHPTDARRLLSIGKALHKGWK